jgi:A/G-specific adenine glycosylase
VSFSLSKQQCTTIWRLLPAWYRTHARQLPWRGTHDLYRIWISEIMLQQTQVITVIDYFTRFMERFPNVAALAAAEEAEVLRYWEGLGYYRRARQLHAAARLIREQHHSEFPESFDDVLRLPGIGRYTAGAILSIGRDSLLPILEANTVRLHARLLAYPHAVQTPKAQQLLWQSATDLLPKQDIGLFNQALMDLGSLVCVPRTPHCGACPIRTACNAYRKGLQHSIPLAKIQTQYESVAHTAFVLQDAQGKVLLRQHPPQERWAGLWDFPRLSCVVQSDEQIVHDVLATTGLHVKRWQRAPTIKHGVTKYRITLEVVLARITRKNNRSLPSDADYRWCELPELAELPMNSTGRKIARWLLEKSLV